MMKRTYRVGKGFGKKNFDQAINMAGNGDVIMLDPGTYSFMAGYTLKHSISIIGTSEDPRDVKLQSVFTLRNGQSLTLKNLVLTTNNSNGINLKERTHLEAEKVVFQGELTGEYPVVWVENSTASFINCEIEYGHNSGAVYAVDASNLTFNGCIIDSVHVNDSNLVICNSQIVTILSSKRSTVQGQEYLEVLENQVDTVSMLLQEGTRSEFDLLAIPQGLVHLKVLDSILNVTALELPDQQKLNLLINQKGQTTLDDSQVEVYNLDEEGKIVEQHSAQVVTEKAQEEIVEAEDTDYFNEWLDEELPGQLEEAEEISDPQAATALQKLNELNGLEKVKQQALKFIKMVQFNQQREAQGLKANAITLHSLFLGNPGTGKTTVARLLGEILADEGVIRERKFVEVDRTDLVDEIIGGTAKRTMEKLVQATGGVLFIDEAYSLFSEGQNDFGREAVDTILKYIEDHREDIMVIFAGYTDKMQNFINMNPGLRSRVPNVFDFEDYTPTEIAEIGYRHLLENDYSVVEQRYKELVSYRYGHSMDASNARWVRNFNDELISIMADRVLETNSQDTMTITSEDLDQLTGGNLDEKQARITEQIEKLNQLVGLETIKVEVKNLIKEAQANRELLKVSPHMTKPAYHMVFEGNPGTGKTSVAEIIAKLFYNLDILPTPNVKVVERSNLVGSYVGHTEKNTKQVIEEAMGGVLFVDEAYQLTLENSGNDFGKQAVETLLTALENYRDKFVVIFAGYTNEMEHFLNANPGLRSRVQKRIIFPDYTPDEIAQIVRNILKRNWQFDEQRLQTLVSDLYQKVPANERANGRWARNFSEALEKQQKIYIVDKHIKGAEICQIQNELIEEVVEHFL